MPAARERPRWLNADPDWYRDAVIYELHVRAFMDSDADGAGDFRGLTQKLDYLRDLGVTTLWLLPFYPSPLRDDGYDIADYRRIHPSFGTMRDFRTFLRAARERGLHVIVELVVNHTSDEHAWFQRARRAKAGSVHRDFYVWSDTADRYDEARIIFQDFEPSNWTWDPVAQAHFWHRFYSHQPDLNYDNPHVRDAIIRVMDYWLDMGVSGLRLDAVPYLIERDGTNCENLPETHDVLRQLRHHMDDRFPGRMLLAEANQWPEDAAAYFGDGDECHMAFHFPIMPRLFMALRMEDYTPVVDMLEQTPQIPDGCQWGMFLRNHDELTLEMVTDEERDYMYRMYAHDRHMRINVGIRRRLAPLLGNDRRRIELLNGLLFSLPGTPVIYYGDEIGMGDNFFLGDRNGVRTPMQWSGDRNAGFSRSNPQSLYLPVVIDPEYHYEAINVETQLGNPDSLLWWMRRLIAVRKRHKAFSRGVVEILRPENHHVLAFVTRHEDEDILVVANLSRFPQQVSLDLPQFQNRQPIELFGGMPFPAIGGESYSLTLSGHTFFWFQLKPARIEAQAVVPAEPALFDAAPRRWENLFRGDVPETLVDLLVKYVQRQRWFGSKARSIQNAGIIDAVPVPVDDSWVHVVFLRLEYSEGEPETYQIPLASARADHLPPLLDARPEAIVCRVRTSAGDGSSEELLYDALCWPEFGRVLLDAVRRHRRFGSQRGVLTCTPTRNFRGLSEGMSTDAEPELLSVEQSNTSLRFGDRFILKVYRKVEEGMNPDLELGRRLIGRGQFPNTAPVAGALEYQNSRRGDPTTVGILHGHVQNVGDAWAYTRNSLSLYYERLMAERTECPPVPDLSLLQLRAEEPPPEVTDSVGPYLVSAQLLGQRTAELHLALARGDEDAAFRPERFTLLYQRSLSQAIRNDLTRTFQLLRRRLGSLPDDVRADAGWLLGQQADILSRISRLNRRRFSALRIRTHGDYHLGQVLYTGQDFVIIDFEGEPARALSERRIKRSPIRDVAGMLRSFDYASSSVLTERIATFVHPEETASLEPWGALWQAWASAAFLKGYLETDGAERLVPDNDEDLQTLLDAFLLDKALYEVSYELNSRPDWVRIPLHGIIRLLGRE